MKFKRAMLAEPGRFEIYEIEENCGPDNVMVKIESCGLCNWEQNFWKGHLNFYGYPHKLGHEFAGTIVEIGENVKEFAIGDNVTCFCKGMGGFGEYVSIPATGARKLADGIDPKYGFSEPEKCVMTVLRTTAPEAGDYGIVQGCGPMGLWAIMGFAGNYLGALIAVDIDDDKLALAKKYGATHIINSRTEDAVARVREITKGHMADFLIEGTGIPALLNAGQDMLKNTGRAKLVLMSSHEEICKEFDFRKAIDRGLDLLIAHPPRSYDQQDDFRRAVDFINNGTFKVKELVTHEFKLSDINKAFEALENKPKGYLKGIVVPD